MSELSKQQRFGPVGVESRSPSPTIPSSRGGRATGGRSEDPPLSVSTPSKTDRNRQTPTIRGVYGPSTDAATSNPSRRQPSGPAPARPLTATPGATAEGSVDPDLAAVVRVWDDLPEAVRAGI